MSERGRDIFARYKKIIDSVTFIYKLLPIKIRKNLLEFHRNSRGKIGLGIRYALLKSIAVECGDNVAIYQGVYIMNPENFRVGNNVSIHPMCYIECGYTQGGVSIGNDVSIAHGVTLMSTSHVYDGLNAPIKDNGVIYDPIHIEDNVWIGTKVTITAGISVASGCVIGANAVVTQNTERNGVYVGVPAKKIKER